MSGQPSRMWTAGVFGVPSHTWSGTTHIMEGSTAFLRTVTVAEFVTAG